MTTQDTSALLDVDMQNDFLAKGGYYDEKDKRIRAAQGKLSATGIDDLAHVYLHPPTTCEIRKAYQDFVRTVTEVAAAALKTGLTTIFVQAAYNPDSCYRPPLFLRNPQPIASWASMSRWFVGSSNKSIFAPLSKSSASATLPRSPALMVPMGRLACSPRTFKQPSSVRTQGLIRGMPFGQKTHLASRASYMSKRAGSPTAANRASSNFNAIVYANRLGYVTAVRTA